MYSLIFFVFFFSHCKWIVQIDPSPTFKATHPVLWQDLSANQARASGILRAMALLLLRTVRAVLTGEGPERNLVLC